ncbi:lasso RiPP family leader peptide-containing protein [Nocardiopsis sp. CA-288880]
MNPDQTPTSDPVAYEPPQVTDLGRFGDLTRGNVFAGTSDDGTGAGRFYT